MSAEYRIVDRAHRVMRAEALLRAGARLGTIQALTGLSEGLIRQVREELGIKTRKGANPAVSRFYMGSNDARMRTSAFYGVYTRMAGEMGRDGEACLSDILLASVEMYNRFMTEQYSIDRAYYFWYYLQSGSFKIARCERCRENLFVYDGGCPARAMRACPSCLYHEFRHAGMYDEHEDSDHGLQLS